MSPRASVVTESSSSSSDWHGGASSCRPTTRSRADLVWSGTVGCDLLIIRLIGGEFVSSKPYSTMSICVGLLRIFTMEWIGHNKQACLLFALREPFQQAVLGQTMKAQWKTREIHDSLMFQCFSEIRLFVYNNVVIPILAHVMKRNHLLA